VLQLAPAKPEDLLLADEVEVDIRNADAHATAQHLAKGTIIIPTHDGTVREISPILVEQRYWGLRCLLSGVDAALELRVMCLSSFFRDVHGYALGHEQPRTFWNNRADGRQVRGYGLADHDAAATR
jgi:hypothetical protein